MDKNLRHTERCRDCKDAVAELLGASFGDVWRNYSLGLPSALSGYRDSPVYGTLRVILRRLQAYRGYGDFVRSKKLARVDYFIPSARLVVEFDESQHFTAPRAISLGLYPRSPRIRFDVSRWIELCETLNKTDSDPPYRPEQRAWYDALRDFAPFHALAETPVRGTVRVHSKALKWCDLDPGSPSDLRTFRAALRSRKSGAQAD